MNINIKFFKIKILLIFAALFIADFNFNFYAANAAQNINAADGEFPSSYSLVDDGFVSAVKDQGQHGNCWAFAVMGALESNYLKNKESLENILGDEPNLSALYTAWFAFNNPEAGLSFSFIDADGEISPDAMPVFMLEGGQNNNLKAAALFARLDGPILNTDLAYPEANKYALPWRPEDMTTAPEMSSPDKIYNLTVNNTVRGYSSVAYMPDKDKKPSDYASVLRVTGALVCSGDEAGVRDFIKNMINTNGAVAVTIDLYRNGFRNVNSSGIATYFSGELTSNFISEHNVLITGWDDSFSRENFGANKPVGSGAWLVQNSWGENWGNNGYFWLSYEEATLKTPVAFTTEVYDAHIRHYGNDDLGWTGRIYIGDGDENSAWFASAMRVAGDHEKLREVGFYTADANMAYQIYVYKHGNITSITSPLSNELLEVTGGICDYAGYHVVKLSESVPLERGCLFSIVMKLSTENSGVPIAVETKINETETEGAVVNEGRSFFSLNGMDWTDGTKLSDIVKNSIPDGIRTADACIKAFTFIPDQRRAEDWLIARNGNKVDMQLTLFCEDEPANVVLYGNGITDLKCTTELEKDTTTGAAASASADATVGATSGNFYKFNVSGTVTEGDPALTLFSINGTELRMPDGGVRLSGMTVNTNDSSGGNSGSQNTSSRGPSTKYEGCNAGFNFNLFLFFVILLFNIIIFARKLSDK